MALHLSVGAAQIPVLAISHALQAHLALHAVGVGNDPVLGLLELLGGQLAGIELLACVEDALWPRNGAQMLGSERRVELWRCHFLVLLVCWACDSAHVGGMCGRSRRRGGDEEEL